MGKTFFGVDMQSEFGSAFSEGTVPTLTLRKKSYGAYDVTNPSSGRTITTADYSCRGTIGSFTREEAQEDKSIMVDDAKASIVAKPLADAGVEPIKDDLLVDDDGRVWTIIGVRTSGFRVSYVLHIR